MIIHAIASECDYQLDASVIQLQNSGVVGCAKMSRTRLVCSMNCFWMPRE